MRVAARSRASSSCCAAYVSSQRRRAAARCSSYAVQPPPKRRPPRRRCRAPSGRGRTGRCRRRRAGPGRGWRAAPRPVGRAGTPSARRSRRRRGGWSARRAAGSAGRVVISVARASRVRWPTGEGADAARRGRAGPARAARLPRGSAVGVPRVVGDRAVERGGVRRLAGLVVQVRRERSTSATISRSGASAPARTSATVWVVAERRLLAEQRQVGWVPSTAPVTTARAGRVPATARSSVDLPAAVLADQADPAAGAATRSMACSTCRVPNQTSRSVMRSVGRSERRHAGAFGSGRGSPGGASGASRVSAAVHDATSLGADPDPAPAV